MSGGRTNLHVAYVDNGAFTMHDLASKQTNLDNPKRLQTGLGAEWRHVL